MYWIMLSERSDEYEFSIDETPPAIEENDWQFDVGELHPEPLPVIDIPFSINPDEIMTDNIIAYGVRGLLFNSKVKAVFDRLGIDIIQYFQARLVNRETKEIFEPYWIGNIVGKHSCVDHDNSELEYFADGDIEFIDKLALIPMQEGEYGDIFRLAEFLPLIVVSDRLKVSLQEAGIKGFTFYKPEDFSL